MNVTVRIIPHEEQRYETVGDWVFLSDDHLVVTISNLDNFYYSFLVALHEQIEAVLCKQAGIDEKDVTAFDTIFEAERAAGKHDAEAEPGDDPQAPYHEQHIIATQIEKEIAAALKIDWRKYEKAIYAL